MVAITIDVSLVTRRLLLAQSSSDISAKKGHAEAVISKMTDIPPLRPSAGADDDVEAPANFPGPIDSLPLHDIAQRVRPRKDFAQAALFNGYLMPLPASARATGAPGPTIADHFAS